MIILLILCVLLGIAVFYYVGLLADYNNQVKELENKHQEIKELIGHNTRLKELHWSLEQSNQNLRKALDWQKGQYNQREREIKLLNNL